MTSVDVIGLVIGGLGFIAGIAAVYLSLHKKSQ